MLSHPFILEKNNLKLEARALGHDLVVIITGGEEHLGAVAVGYCYGGQSKKSNASLLSLPGHKEDVLIFPIARRLSKTLATNVAVIAGIHFEKLSAGQIMDIVQTAESLVDELISAIQKTEQS